MAKKIATTQPESAEAKPVKTVKAKVVKEKTTVKKTAKSTAVTIISDENKAVIPYSRFSDFDIALFQSGKHYKLYEKLGSHVVEHNGVVGTYFAVWAPNAHYVSVIANFNGWNKASHALYIRWDGSVIWEGFQIPARTWKKAIHLLYAGKYLRLQDR
jgi:1,4-alpha-glucan branching enzyme